MRKLVVGCWLLVAGALGALEADACTGMYAGKGVTADGSVLIGRTVDFSPYNATMFQQVCEPGTQEPIAGKANRYRYVCAPKATSLKAGRYAGSAANEKGVILTGTVTGATRSEALAHDPFVPEDRGGVGEPYLPDYLIGNAATARKAVELLREAVAEHGHSGAEIYMVADTNEAWYVEVYTGHDWAAVKMPEDKVAVFGNHFNLRGFDTNDMSRVMFSPTLFTRAVDEGFAVWTDDESPKLDLYRTYADPAATETNYNNFRAWYGHRRFAPSSVPNYETNLVCELFFAPDFRLAPTNMFELMRARYEDLSDEELPTARTNAAIRVIGTTKQGNCHVLQLDCREGTPETMRGTVWSCLGQSEHDVFHPVNAATRSLPAAYTNDAQRTFGYDPGRAADAYRRLSALAQSDRVNCGAGVRAYWRSREVRMADEWPKRRDAAILADDPQKLTDYTRTEEERSLAAARRLYDELIWYKAANNRISGDGSGATDEPPEPFKPRFRFHDTGCHEAEFGGIKIQTDVNGFLKSGFALGDLVDVRFANGRILEGVPVYDGYYVGLGEHIVVCLNDEVCIRKNLNGDLYDDLDLDSLSETFGVEITLREPGGCYAVQSALSLAYTDDRADYASDEVFANFRAMTGGDLVANLFYRGASPCDNRHNRVPFVNKLMGDHHIQCVIDLAGSPQKIADYRADNGLDAQYWKELVDGGKVHSHAVSADFTTQFYREQTVAALWTILGNDGPYYLHCQEGKDRTGVLCCIVESLAGATVEEVEADYMRTFANYYGVDPNTDSERYGRVRDVFFARIVCYFCGCGVGEWTTKGLYDGVVRYLKDGGMSESEITKLVAKLKGEEVR